ncbi:hypothetical protein FOZ62_001415 [Perkinsus olseni]|uniref:Secreted protein n=1 Tax=Perkinsus olseni TaxID=32597 RepID=A0A7J6RIY9_PEROL|nr:hypothetical protein FOZ62_001415 [Perkinsus olseni]
MLRIATVIAIVAISASIHDEGVLPVARGHGTFGHSENHTMEEFTGLNGFGGDRSSDGLTSMTNCRTLVRAPQRRVLGQAGGIRALGGPVGSCPASPLGPTECLSGKCFLSPMHGCPAGMKGFSLLKFGPVCMYTK